MQLELPRGFQSVKGLPRQRQLLYNLMFSNGIQSRPGVTSLPDGSGECRAQFRYQEKLHQVSGTSLLRFDSAGNSTSLGTIAGTAEVAVAVDFGGVALVVKGGTAYTLVDSTLATITDTDYVVSQDVVAIDGFFIYIPSDGGPAFFSEVGLPGDIDPLAFFDAETSPDVNVGAAKVSNDLLILGADTIEVLRHTGPDSAPFLRVLGATLSLGYFGGRVKYRIQGVETLCFIGKEEDAGVGIYSLQGKLPNSDAVDELLQGYSEQELREAIGQRFTWNSIDSIVFRLARHTLVFNGEWALFGTGFDSDRWQVKYITFAYGHHVVGTDSASIGYLDDVDDDFGEKIDRYFDTFIRAEAQTDFSLDFLECQVTYRRLAGSLGLSLSQDGVIYGPTFWRTTPAVGKYTHRVVFNYPGGLGSFESFAGIRIRTTERITFNTDSLRVGDGAQ